MHDKNTPTINPIIKVFLFCGSAILIALISSFLIDEWFGEHVVLDMCLISMIVLLLSFRVGYWDRKAEEFRALWLKIDTKFFIYVLTGCALGIVLIIVSAVLSWRIGGVKFYINPNARWLDIAQNGTLFLFVSLFEELISRGYMLFCLNKAYGSKVAIIVTSVVFTLMHGLNPHMAGWIGASAFANLFIAGWLMADLTIRTKNLGAAIGLHWIWNFVQGPILGFGVSGNTTEKSLLIPNIPSFKPLLTGGEFGLEAAIPTSICLLLTVILVNKYIQQHECHKYKTP